MLEKTDLTKELAKDEWKELRPALQRQLYDLERAGFEAGMPTIIVFEGWDASGKGTTINMLTQRLDPRGFRVWPIRAARTSEQNRPWLWRFWLKLPNRGEIAIFDRSWYGRVLVERVEKLIPEQEWQKGYRDIVDFEQMLAEDGHLIVKFWLHVSKVEQRRRFRALEKDPVAGLARPAGGLGAPSQIRCVFAGRRGNVGAHRDRVCALDHRGGHRPTIHALEGDEHHRGSLRSQPAGARHRHRVFERRGDDCQGGCGTRQISKLANLQINKSAGVCYLPIC